jgi:hypothetical protein
MFKRIVDICIIITLAFIGTAAKANDNIYRYIKGQRVEMIINRSYIVLDINTNEFTGWNNLFTTETALDASEYPVNLVGDIYRLKVTDTEKTDDLIFSLTNYNGIIESNYAFMTESGLDYYLGYGLTVIFKDEITTSVIDSIIEFNNLEIVYKSDCMPNLYFLESSIMPKIAKLALANEIAEKGFAISAHIGYILPIQLCSAPNDTFYEQQYYMYQNQTDFEEALEYNLGNDTIHVAILDSGMEPHEDFPGSKITGYRYVPPMSSDYSLDNQCEGGSSACFH